MSTQEPQESVEPKEISAPTPMAVGNNYVPAQDAVSAPIAAESGAASEPEPAVEPVVEPTVESEREPDSDELTHDPLVDQLIADKRSYAREKVCSPMSKASWVEEYGEECKGVKKAPPEVQQERQLRFQANQEQVLMKRDKLIRKGLRPKFLEGVFTPPVSDDSSSGGKQG